MKPIKINYPSCKLPCRGTKRAIYWGVTGVGLEMNQIQQLLENFSKEFDLDAMLFDRDGNVLIHANSSTMTNKNVFDSKALAQNKKEILDNTTKLGIYQYKEGQAKGVYHHKVY